MFLRHAYELETGAELERAFRSKVLHLSHSVDDSKAINRLKGFVVAASGMCDAGRIRHHLKNRLWQRNATVLMVGYQTGGSMGRLLLDGAKRVRIQGDDITVNAQIHSMDDYSGHADGTELTTWIEEHQPIRKNLFLVHSELPASSGLRDCVADRVIAHNRIIIPSIDEVFTLTAK